MGNIPFLKNKDYNFQIDEIDRLNQVEASNDLRYMENLEEFSFDELDHELALQIKSALTQVFDQTTPIVSLYLYLPQDKFRLSKGTYLCTNTKLIKVTSSNWIDMKSQSKNCTLIIACKLDKAVILGRRGLVSALKQAGALEQILKVKLGVRDKDIGSYQAIVNLNVLAFDAGLNINEIVILGVINLKG
ncbi:hypothetical protein ABZU06_04015 [Lactobacillus iners]|uniref:hypothetical protein n=1 Tax=Lactobacillus iners TaxID=147802 RepID=UPI0036F49D3D